ncbi:hypothetical protein BN1051_00975 [Arthrobacter saudimassiliensis]|uniref:DUF4345 domain-containing protein n=1 Tax=Arthrobacter saudimassiliensis TaxID=1461584 RepID=A0A078MMZ2_9MICC|nr:hypothetical protein BN1051_00975 [Arthrobacter saudimassiliensis]
MTSPGTGDLPGRSRRPAVPRTGTEESAPPAGAENPARPGAPDAGPPARTAGGAAPDGRGAAGRAAVQRGTAPGSEKNRTKTPQHDNSAWGVFRAVVVAVGLLIAAMGIYYLIAGTGGVAGGDGGEVNPSLESQFRFFSMMMVGVGAAFVAIAVKFQWANMLWLVCLMVFLGGLGRVLSWAFSGTPHFTMIVLMILELAFPPALLVWHRFIAKTVALRAEYAQGRLDGGSGGGARS